MLVSEMNPDMITHDHKCHNCCDKMMIVIIYLCVKVSYQTLQGLVRHKDTQNLPYMVIGLLVLRKACDKVFLNSQPCMVVGSSVLQLKFY